MDDLHHAKIIGFEVGIEHVGELLDGEVFWLEILFVR